MNKELLRMQMLAGIITESQYAAESNESEGTKYFIVIIFEGLDDELGSMKGISASSQKEFEQKIETLYGPQGLKDIKANPDDTYWTFYEVSSQEEINKIEQMSEDWDNGDQNVEEELIDIAKKGKPFDQISF